MQWHLVCFFFIWINFVPQLHIIGRSLVLYNYVSSFITKLGEKLHLSSGMNITMLLVWYHTIVSFNFFVKWNDAERSVLHMDAMSHSHYAWEICHTLKFSQSLIARSLQIKLKMMILGISKQLFTKPVHVRVKKLRFSDAGHVLRTRQCSTQPAR